MFWWAIGKACFFHISRGGWGRRWSWCCWFKREKSVRVVNKLPSLLRVGRWPSPPLSFGSSATGCQPQLPWADLSASTWGILVFCVDKEAMVGSVVQGWYSSFILVIFSQFIKISLPFLIKFLILIIFI